MPQLAERDPGIDEGQQFSGSSTKASGGAMQGMADAGKAAIKDMGNKGGSGGEGKISPFESKQPGSASRGGSAKPAESAVSRAAKGAKAADKTPGGMKDPTVGTTGKATAAAVQGSGMGKSTDEQGGTEKAARAAGGKAARGATDALTGSDQAGQAVEQVVKNIDFGKAAKLGCLTLAAAAMIPILMVIIAAHALLHPWDAVKKVLTDASFRRFATSAAGLSVGDGNNKTLMAIAGKMPYEADYKAGSAIAAPAGQRPEPGTLLDTISKIDYEKSRNKYKGSYCSYKVITKKVVAFDGKSRSVIDKVVDSKGATVELSDPTVFSCVLEQYPVMEAMMRSPETRKINQQMQVNLSYAEKKDSKTLEGKSKEEIKKTLDKKTLDRIWKNGDASTECVQDFKPDGSKADKAIKKVVNDLVCGDKPEDINVDYPIDDYDEIPSSKEDKAKQAASQAETICLFYKKLNEDKEALKKYRLNRAKSSARAGVQALTLADTGVAGEIPIDELNTDFYKVSNFASSRAYNQEINGVSTGKQMDPEAIPTTTIGLTKDLDADLAAQGLLTYSSQCKALDSQSSSGGGFFGLFSGLFGNGGGDQDQTVLNIRNLTILLRKQIADANPQVYSSLKEVTLNDIIVRTIKLTTNASNSGVENGPDNFNRMIVGAKNTSYVYTMSLLGGSYQTPGEAAQASAQVEEMKRNRDKQNGIAYRLINTDNPRSLASRLAAETTATPRQVTEKTTQYAINLLNPIRAFAELNTAIAYYGYGDTNRAIAAGDDDQTYWKIDTAGVSGGQDVLKNAAYIEALKKKVADPAYANDKTIQAVGASFAAWDKCMETYYPDKQAVDDDPNGRSCQIMRKSNKGKVASSQYTISSLAYNLPSMGARLASLSATDEKELAKRYAQYKGNMNLYGAWAKLSSDEPDESMYANGSAGGTAAAPVGNAIQSDPGADTSGTPCPQEPGITTAPADSTDEVDAQGVAQTYGPGKVPKNKVKLCIVQGIRVNVSIASNLNAMINAAKADGISLSGGGWRSYNRQKELRGTNGCPADDNASSSTCRVPTARPGTSNHEQGEAIDFSNTSTRGTANFGWLTAHAATYGLKNFPKEAWHWSRTGG